MAKLNVTVDNDLDTVKLESHKKIESKKKNDKKEKKSKESKKGILTGIRQEMKLVTWPTRKHIFKYFVSTTVMIVLLALFFIGISLLFDLLYRLVQGWIG